MTTMSATPQIQAAQPSAPPLSLKLLIALLGIFVSAMMAGLNNRVGALGLADIRGALGFASDDASWITTAYTIGELVATPFATWFAITLSVRRFHFWMASLSALIALFLPYVHSIDLLIGLRFIQGVTCGALIPILMMAALKFLPPSIKLHGLALYAMTATFAPNIAIWLAGQWTDGLMNWHWLYWQSIPLCLFAMLLVGYGLPKESVKTARFSEANWLGMLIGSLGLGLFALSLDQGVRLDWFNSPLIVVSFMSGLVLIAIYLTTEWFHPAPFLKLQLLARRNLWLGCCLFVSILVALLSGVQLPSNYLGAIQEYRLFQTAPVALLIALPQLVLGSVVAILLYQKWVDARQVFAVGLALIAAACFLGAELTGAWNRDQFLTAQLLQALGQPMSVVSLLFLMTSVVKPDEGPFFSGTINTLRVFGSLIGGAIVGQLLAVRGRFHTEMMIDYAANHPQQASDPSQVISVINQQSLILSVADVYRILGSLALVLIPVVLCMSYIPAPNTKPQHP